MLSSCSILWDFLITLFCDSINFFQNERYKVLSSQIEEAKNEAFDAKMRADKSGHTRASKRIRELTLGLLPFEQSRADARGMQGLGQIELRGLWKLAQHM